MSTQEVGKRLVSLCQEGQYQQAIQELYAEDIVSVEAAAMPGHPRTMKGKAAMLEKLKWWQENNEVHSGKVVGPFPHGDRFAVFFDFDVTCKQAGRMKMVEVGIYTVEDGKITKEEFFYDMGG
ncbi:MAG: SnoaL-like domain-containing protein [Phycisphaerales bacterium]